MNLQKRINYLRSDYQLSSKDTQKILDFTIFFNYLDGEIADEQLHKFMADFTQLNVKKKETKYLFSLQLFVNYGILLYRYVKVLTLIENNFDSSESDDLVDFYRNQLFDYYNGFINYLNNVKWIPPSLLKLYHNLFLSFVRRRNYKRFRQLYIYWFNHLLTYIFGNSLEEMVISSSTFKLYPTYSVDAEYDLLLLLYLINSLNGLFFSNEKSKILRTILLLFKMLSIKFSLVSTKLQILSADQIKLFADLNLHLNLLRYNHLYLYNFIK